MQTLPIMGKGMLGIFLVTAVLILGTYLMNRLLADHPDEDGKEN